MKKSIAAIAIFSLALLVYAHLRGPGPGGSDSPTSSEVEATGFNPAALNGDVKLPGIGSEGTAPDRSISFEEDHGGAGRVLDAQVAAVQAEQAYIENIPLDSSTAEASPEAGLEVLPE